jgi:hypothetical protein
METEAMSTALNSMIDIIRRVDVAKPTKDDKAALERLLQEQPAVWRAAGDLMEFTASKMINNSRGTYALKRSMSVGWEQIQKDMARPGDGELERLLIQQVALSWMKLAYTEYLHESYLTDGNTTIKQCDFWERRLSAAQRRYLRATETLARVRRLQLPAVQINVGAQQVNQVK